MKALKNFGSLHRVAIIVSGYVDSLSHDKGQKYENLDASDSGRA